PSPPFFPTRRSSDLGGAVSVNYGYDSRVEILGTKGILFIGSLKENTVLSCNRGGLNQSVISSWMYLFEDAYLAEDRLVQPAAIRSEEHTSELQSREN